MLYFSKLRIFTILIASLFFLFFTLSNFTKLDDSFFNKKINLGLDLQGGSYLLLEIDNKPVITKELQNKITFLKTYFKNKNINIFNLKIYNQNSIRFETDETNVELIKDIFVNKEEPVNPFYEKYKSHQFDLENQNNIFTITLSKYGIIELKNSSLDQAIEIVRRRIDEVGTNEPNILKRGNDRILVELPGLDDPMRIKNLLGKTANLTFRFVSKSTEAEFGTDLMEFEDGSESPVYINKRIILSGENLLDAQPRVDSQTNETVVTFSLDRVGAKRFGKATISGVGKRFAIILDDKIISAPVIQEAIVDGSGQITGGFTFQSATDLALLLRSGALPAPMNIIEERTVGPGLGKDSIKAGVLALIIGFSLVIAFMIFKYKIFGLIANTALIFNLFFLVGILTLFEATLTLPGIAGIILTVGMAVDANVLIFARISEELKNNIDPQSAIKNGFAKAFSTIMDANITTLLVALILYAIGTGPIKGFAITLSIGIITSIFTAILVTRSLVNFIYGYRDIKELKI